jgi:hypothetical protein
MDPGAPSFDSPAVQRAYELCKLHAATDDAFDDVLTRQWFKACYELCVDFTGLVYPPQRIKEQVTLDARGRIYLSYPPSSNVDFYRGIYKVASLPPNSPCLQGSPNSCSYDWDPEVWDLERSCCPPALCDCVGSPLTAIYQAGEGCGPNDDLPAWFVQGLAQVFTWYCENRGDTQFDAAILSKCGAMTFLQRGVTFVL